CLCSSRHMSPATSYILSLHDALPICSWAYWDYGYIHNINLFLVRAENADALDPADKERFMAEARFLRANTYFEMVKRMGGVPLLDRKSTRLNSSHVSISYAVFCLKKK